MIFIAFLVSHWTSTHRPNRASDFLESYDLFFSIDQNTYTSTIEKKSARKMFKFSHSSPKLFKMDSWILFGMKMERNGMQSGNSLCRQFKATEHRLLMQYSATRINRIHGFYMTVTYHIWSATFTWNKFINEFHLIKHSVLIVVSLLARLTLFWEMALIMR